VRADVLPVGVHFQASHMEGRNALSRLAEGLLALHIGTHGARAEGVCVCVCMRTYVHLCLYMYVILVCVRVCRMCDAYEYIVGMLAPYI